MTAPTPIHGGFDEAELHHVLDQACLAAGLDPTGARLLRGHTNAVILLEKSPVVVKIARRGSNISDVQRTVRFVQLLMENGFPTVPLHPIPEQPAVINEHAVTFWVYLPQPALPVMAAQLAEPLHALHNFPLPSFPVKRHDNIRAIRKSLSATTSLPEGVITYLKQRADRLEMELAGVRFELPEGILQGDPQHRNALHDRGRVVLCDWDTFSLGQPEWDLVTVEVHCRRFGYGADHYQKFSEEYGYDITKSKGFRTLRDVRELRMITTNARKARHSPGSLVEVERRIHGLRHENYQLQWNIL
ncbi:phosphotransferase family protein [Streptomyces sp. NPDC059037]|uniref:phosphotransferase family protein n=1 Tax=Streptomyces sp. NPDC059037 TaxID=3346710 RepID=UPI0036CB80EC